MRTILAPGTEVHEVDLSFYNFPQTREETQNVLVTGFSPKGHSNYSYEFSNKNTDDDLIATFGTPTTEAERYFFNTCSEAIKRDKTVLYATRLPYDNDAGKNYRIASYSCDVNDAKKINELVGDLAELNTDEKLGEKYLVNIKANSDTKATVEDIEKYRSSQKLPRKNEFIIVEKNQELYSKIPVDATHMSDQSRELIGILPVVTTAPNALYYQKLIKAVDEDYTYLSGNQLVTVKSNIAAFEATKEIYSDSAKTTILSNMLVYPASSEGLEVGNKSATTISQYAAGFFPTINILADGTFDRDDLRQIGIVVFKGWVDAENGNKIKFEPVEAFAGSLKSDTVDVVTGVSKFIDDIVNTNSKTIEFYSNCFNSFDDAVMTAEAPTTDTADDDKNIKTTSKMKFKTGVAAVKSYSDIGMLMIANARSQSLAFSSCVENPKRISTSLIASSLDKIFEKNKNINEKQIDLVVDAGVSNIAQFLSKVTNGETNNWIDFYDPTYISGTKSAAQLWDICKRIGDGEASVTEGHTTDKWELILKKYDQYCKTRGDCMFLADGLRPFCICGKNKRVRPTNANTTISKTLTPFIKYMSGKIDTSYGAGYCDWYQIVDPTSGVNIWMPPSTKAMCIMLDNYVNKYFWTIPAGVNTGRLNPNDNPSPITVTDIAFSPTVQEAGDIYAKSWNYATYYQDEGFVMEGQRTFQRRATAFDRINTRRAFLYLERKTALAAKYFLYEGNTAYTRQRFVDTITPFFEDCKIKKGIADYRIQCDDKNNTPDTIDRNELHVKVAIKPTKAIEFIEITFVCLRTGASWSEAGM